MKIFNKLDFSNKENNILYFILFVFILLLIFVISGNNKLDIQFIKQENKIKEIQNVLEDTPIEAKAVSIYDETFNIKIYGKYDEEKLPIASLAKIITVAVVLNNSKLDDVISISRDAIKQEGDYGLFVNEKIKIGDLAKFTLIGSSNDGVYALAESQNINNTKNSHLFLEKINEKARKIGMENSLFFNFTGLDIDEVFTGPPRVDELLRVEAGAYASAQDVNIMAIYALKAYPRIFSASIMPEINIVSESGFRHNIKNTDVILDKIPNILFSKTGYTPLAGGNLVIIYKNKYDHDIAITVLGSTIDGRFTDMEKIVDTLYNLDYGNGN